MKEYLCFLLKNMQIGFIGFGGGNALIPVIEQTLVGESRKEKAAFDRDIIVANLTPGALPVEILSSVGSRTFGIPGMIGAATAFTLPGVVIAVLIMMLFSGNESGAVAYVKTASVGISAFIICLLGKYVYGVIKQNSRTAVQSRRTKLMITLVCFVVCGKNLVKITGISYTPFFGVSTITVLAAAFFCAFYVQSFTEKRRIAVAAPLCLLFFLSHGQRGILSDTAVSTACEVLMVVLAAYGAIVSVKNHPHWHPVNVKLMIRDLGCWFLFMLLLILPALLTMPSFIPILASFVSRGCLSSLMSFGGGDAYLAVAEGLFVDSGLISSEDFYSTVVTVVNVTPGSILCKTLSATGYIIGRVSGGSAICGITYALAGLGCSIAMSCIAFGMVNHLYDSIIELQMFRALSRWIRPIVAGLLINVSLSLISQSLALRDYIDVNSVKILLFIIPMVLINALLRKRIPDPVLLIADAAAALIFFL